MIMKVMSVSKNEYRKLMRMASGKTIALCLPKRFAVDLGIGYGDFVKIHQEEQRIVIEKVE